MFMIGDRIKTTRQYNAQARGRCFAGFRGVVTGFGRKGRRTIRVLKDGRKHSISINQDFIEKVET